MRQDRRQNGAAYLEVGWMLRAGVSRRIDEPEARGKRTCQTGICCRSSQGLRYYADQPIPRPNSS
jgi:hypothetical protein